MTELKTAIHDMKRLVDELPLPSEQHFLLPPLIYRLRVWWWKRKMMKSIDRIITIKKMLEGIST